MKTLLTTSACYNPFFLEGKQIHDIKFYKDGQILASCRWFGSNNNYKTLEFDFEVKKAIRPNLTRKDAFYVLSPECDKRWKEYDLYIYAELVGLESLGVSEFTNSWHSTSTKETFAVNLRGERWKVVKAEPCKETNWQSWKHITVYDDYKEKFDCKYVFNDTPEKKKCEQLAENIAKKTGVKLDYYQIHDILEHFTINEK